MQAIPRHYKTSDDLCQSRSIDQNRIAFISFSMGKDSIGAWLQMRKYFDYIIPVYFTPFPGLQFIADSIGYYEKFFGTRIIQVPHPSFMRFFNSVVFQPPERIPILENLYFDDYEYEDIFDYLRSELSIGDDIYYATGVRSSDSIYRRVSIKTHGSLNPTKRSFMAVFDWNQAKLVEELKKSKIKLPIDYKWWGKTFDGVDYRFLNVLKKQAPDDWNRIRDLFPLIEADEFRWEHM